MNHNKDFAEAIEQAKANAKLFNKSYMVFFDASGYIRSEPSNSTASHARTICTPSGMVAKYGYSTPPEGKWSGKSAIPEVGEPVYIAMNNMGAGRVVGYFMEHDWVGVSVKLQRNPDWRKVGVEVPAMVFGAELK